MESSANLRLPFIMPSQAQASVTHNEALLVLDALVMLTVATRTTQSPPAGPAEGDRHIVAASPLGAWAGQAGTVACFQDGAWRFFPPREGWLAWCAADAALLCYSGGEWTESGARAGGLRNVPFLGVNGEADQTNRLSVSSPATLLNHAGGSHRLVINKQGPADTASLVLKDGFSGRAEIGLAGDDRLSVKVSADGQTFIEAMTIDNATGKPSFLKASLLESHCVNLYQDSGRMAGNGANGVFVGAFAFPAYLTPYNGSTVTPRGKFITDNTDYGGAGGALDGDVRDLIETIRHPDYRRFGAEFWVAEVTMGAGTLVPPLTVGGQTAYLSMFNANSIRPPSATFHAYLRALDDDLLVMLDAGQSAAKNGARQASSFAIAPAEGWVSLTIHDAVSPYRSFGYQPNILSLYAKAAGDRYLLACPALIGGITPVHDLVGMITAANSWPA